MATTFRKKVYRLDRLLRDVAVLAARQGEVRAIQAGRSMDPVFREEIMLAVARTNECRYCVFAHEDAARAAGVADEELARLEGLDPADFDRSTWLAVTYARALAQNDFTDVDPELVEQVVEAHGADGRRAIETTARMMTVNNLAGNTVDALASRTRGAPAQDSRICDELAVAALWAVGAAVTAGNITRARRTSPFALLGEFRRFAAAYDAATGA